MSKNAAYNIDPKTDYAYHLQVTYLDRGIPDKLELGKRTSVHSTIENKRTLNTQSLKLKAMTIRLLIT